MFLTASYCYSVLCCEHGTAVRIYRDYQGQFSHFARDAIKPVVLASCRHIRNYLHSRNKHSDNHRNSEFIFILPNEMPKPPPLVLCGPSGSGKSTLVKRLMQEFGDYFGFSISHTTRSPREGEINGREYHFVSRDIMETKIKNEEFIEYAEFSGNYYGTSKKSVEDVQAKNKICILDIDVQGVIQVKRTNLCPRLVFVQPPTLEDLEKRLRDRGTETPESLSKRLKAAVDEMQYGLNPGNFNIIITNDDVDRAYAKLKDFILPDIESLQN